MCRKITTTAGTSKHPTPRQNKNNDDACLQTLGEGRGGVTGADPSPALHCLSRSLTLLLLVFDCGNPEPWERTAIRIPIRRKLVPTEFQKNTYTHNILCFWKGRCLQNEQNTTPHNAFLRTAPAPHMQTTYWKNLEVNHKSFNKCARGLSETASKRYALENTTQSKQVPKIARGRGAKNREQMTNKRCFHYHLAWVSLGHLWGNPREPIFVDFSTTIFPNVSYKRNYCWVPLT